MVWKTPLVHGVLPVARDCHAAVADNAMMYVFGGCDKVRVSETEKLSPLGDVCVLDTSTSRVAAGGKDGRMEG